MVLITILSISFVQSYAQKGMFFQVSVNPGITMGGKYELPEDVTLSELEWTAMKKKGTFGLDAGLTYGYNFSNTLGVSIGLLYSKQGQAYKDYTWTIGKDNATWKRSVNLNYLKVPIQFRFVSNPEKSISFTASLGIYLGFLLGYKDENRVSATDGSSATLIAKGKTYTQTFGSDSESAAFVNGKPYKSMDFGGMIGVGIQFKLSKKLSLPIGLNYQIGFVDVKNQSCQYTLSGSDKTQLFWQNSDNNSPNATSSYHNSSLELNVGLLIKI